MAVMPREILLLTLLLRYAVMTTTQIHLLCYPANPTGRIVRRRLRALFNSLYIRRLAQPVVNPDRGGSVPAYSIAKKGLEFLSIEFGDDTLLRQRIPSPMHVRHASLVTEFYILLDRAIAAQEYVRMVESYTEHEIINLRDDPKKHFRLFTEIEVTDLLVPELHHREMPVVLSDVIQRSVASEHMRLRRIAVGQRMVRGQHLAS